VAVTTAAVAILEILQRAAGAFELRPLVNVLIVFAVAAATAALSVLVQRKLRERRLSRALRSWPLPRMAEVDRYRLGVFPLRRDLEGPSHAEYVSRGDIDGSIRDALSSASFVLILGPRRAGKSRTALEAAKAVLGDSLVVLPKDADGLRELLDLDPPLLSRRSRAPRWSRSSSAVIWLDGLPRFLEALDANALDALRSGDIPLTIVATIREDEYDALLAGTGAEAEAAKAVVATAQAFELPADGLAARLSSSGKEGSPPHATGERLAGDDEAATRDPRFLLYAGGCAAAVAAIAVIGLTDGLQPSPPLSLPEQADRELREAGATVWGPIKADLHGTGEDSWLFAVAPRTPAPAGGRTSGPASHELRVYDVQGETLVERFRFRPDVQGAYFQYRGLARFGGGGGEKLIGGYGFPAQASLALLSFIVYWEADSGDYRIKALQDEPPELSEGVTAQPGARPYLDAYQERITLRDSREEISISGYRVQDFVVTYDPPRLVSGITFDPKTASTRGQVEVRGSILSLTGSEPALIRCRFEDAQPLRGTWSQGRGLWRDLLRAWQPHIENRDCIPDQ
jgi:hypothetical protein